MGDDSLRTEVDDTAVEPESALGQAQEAVSMLSCPAYRGVGRCESGCYSEPACQTSEPGEHGWLRQLVAAGEEMLLEAVKRG